MPQCIPRCEWNRHPSTNGLYRAAQVRSLEQSLVSPWPGTTYCLMERAGAAAWSLLKSRLSAGQRLGVLVGGGNNGGDGYVLARLARAEGWTVTLHASKPPRPGGDAALAAAKWQRAGGGLQACPETLIAKSDWLVDALLGIGLKQAPAPELKILIDAINASGKPVLAIDLPSGLDADQGLVPGALVKARLTLTFIALKPGLLTGAGLDHCGELWLAPLGKATAVSPDCLRLDWPLVRSFIPARSPDSHKGQFGHVLILGGDSGMGGAALMAAEAALAAGAGRVSLVTRPAHVGAALTRCPELMVHGLDAPEPALLAPLLAQASHLLVGPGIGRGDWGRSLLQAALKAGRPLVLDADALSADLVLPDQPCIFTPHPGEAGRMLGLGAAQVQADRFEALARLLERFPGTHILKGAGTLLAAAGQPVGVASVGNPGMAVAGMGDILAGLCAGFWAQGLTAWQAAAWALVAHGKAGDALAARQGGRGLRATHLLQELAPWLSP